MKPNYAKVQLLYAHRRDLTTNILNSSIPNNVYVLIESDV